MAWAGPMFELAPETKKLLDLFAKGGLRHRVQLCGDSASDRLRSRGRRSSADYTVIRRLERDHCRTLLNLRARGYKVARPGEFVTSMRVRGGKAKRQIVLAKRTEAATPWDLLSEMEGQELTDYSVFVSRVDQAFARVDRELSSQDRRIAAIEDELRERRNQHPVIEGDAVEED